MKFYLYKKTKQWRELENKTVEAYGRQCKYCLAEKSLMARHITFERYGNERLEDLECVCQSCFRDKVWADFYKKKRSYDRHP